MTKKKQTQKKIDKPEIIIQEAPPEKEEVLNCVSIGDIFMQSKNTPTWELLAYCVHTLKDPVVQNYLDFLKQRKNRSGYFG